MAGDKSSWRINSTTNDFTSATGENVCPVTTLYWDFLDRHDEKLKRNHRMAMQRKNVNRKRQQGEMEDIRKQAAKLKRDWLS